MPQHNDDGALDMIKKAQAFPLSARAQLTPGGLAGDIMGKYSDDQERDDHGRFAGGGGGDQPEGHGEGSAGQHPSGDDDHRNGDQAVSDIRSAGNSPLQEGQNVQEVMDANRQAKGDAGGFGAVGSGAMNDEQFERAVATVKTGVREGQLGGNHARTSEARLDKQVRETLGSVRNSPDTRDAAGHGSGTQSARDIARTFAGGIR